MTEKEKAELVRRVWGMARSRQGDWDLTDIVDVIEGYPSYEQVD